MRAALQLCGGSTAAILAVALLGGGNSRAEPAPLAVAPAESAPAERPRRVASYELRARLDPTSHVVTGTGTVRWVNASAAPVRELWLHLYLNAFKNDRTLFLRSPFGAGRSGEHATDWGYVDVTRLSANELGGQDLWASADKNSPGDPDDQTDIRVPLPREVGPGERLTLEISWTSRLPGIVERTGHAGDFHLVGQWFPKLARLETNGAWAHFPFHPHAEFYADFGDYAVTLDVPAHFQVGATGARTDERVENGRRVVRHEIAAAHDFAWTAWDRFRTTREVIDGVAVELLTPPGHDQNARATLDALRSALPRFNALYGRYPHPTLTVVHPPEIARNAGGMEYPALITTGGPWFAASAGVRMVEGVAVHELGHQWFQGVLASHEPKWPFLDEGLNTFAEATAMQARYGAGSLLDLGGFSLSEIWARRAVAVELGHDDVIAQPASDFSSFGSIGALVYARTATVLVTLGNVYGHEGLQRALGSYARRHRFDHPEPQHFLAAIREELGEDAAEQLRAALFDKGWVDYRIDELESAPAKNAAGVFDRGGNRETVDRPGQPEPATTTGRVVVRRTGTLHFPVDVDLRFEDGTVERRRWDGRGAWTAFEVQGTGRLVGAIVDPERLVLLDQSLRNNAKSRHPSGAFRTLERGTYWAQLLLGAVGP